MDARLARIALAALAASLTTSAVAKEVYRWVDENGKVHFSESLPPEYADKPHQKINDAGLVVEDVEDPVAAARQQAQPQKKGPEPIYTEEEIREQSDRLLLLKYHSEKEILEAMEIEIANLGYDRLLIRQTRDGSERALVQAVRQAASLQRANKDIPEDKRKQVADLRRRLATGDADLAALEHRETKIRETFGADLERYRALTAEEAGAGGEETG